MKISFSRPARGPRTSSRRRIIGHGCSDDGACKDERFKKGGTAFFTLAADFNRVVEEPGDLDTSEHLVQGVLLIAFPGADEDFRVLGAGVHKMKLHRLALLQLRGEVVEGDMGERP